MGTLPLDALTEHLVAVAKVGKFLRAKLAKPEIGTLQLIGRGLPFRVDQDG